MSLAGSPLATTGSTYHIGRDRGGSSVNAKTTAGGLATISVTNTSGVPVKLRIVFASSRLVNSTMHTVRIRLLKAWAPRRWIWIAILAAISSGNFATAATTLLDFEDITAPATINAQYAPRGAIFQQAYLGTDPNAHSGTRVLRTVDPSAEIFNPVPLVIKFTSPQARVKMFASNPAATANGTLTAFDSNGAVVATDGPRLVTQDVFTTVFEVKVTTPNIARVELQVQDSAHQAIDDLEFEGEAPAPTPTAPPFIQIISPANGAELDVDTIDINGTVSGAGLLRLLPRHSHICNRRTPLLRRLTWSST